MPKCNIEYNARVALAQLILGGIYKTAALLDETNANARLALDVMLLRMPYLWQMADGRLLGMRRQHCYLDLVLRVAKWRGTDRIQDLPCFPII